jgi:Ca-activated chloride channel family protein
MGKFTLEIPKKCVQLEISYTGFDSEIIEKACHGQSLTIAMNHGTQLEEVVVTSGRIKREKTVSRMLGIRKDRRPSPAVPQSYYHDQQPQWNTEDYSAIHENRFFSVHQEPLSTFSIDVDAASYSNMRRFLKNGQLPPKDAIRVEELINYFEYDYPQPETEHPFEIITELGTCPWQPKHQLLHVGLQGKKIATENLPASNIVFLIDVSGSMNAANKLPLLKSSFKLLTQQLREQDRVAMVVYAGAAGLVLESTPGSNKQKLRAALDNLQAGGSTAGGAGIKLAYKVAREHFIEGGNNRVILATDGDFNVGASSDAEMVRLIEEERKSGIFLTVLGFGMGNYKDNKMQELANKGNGNHAYIDDITEAKKVLVSEFGGTLFTIAKDVKIQIEFNPNQVQAYRLIGYENRLLENEDFNDDTKDAGELGSGHSVTALYEIIPPGVASDFIASVDPLKYQNPEAIDNNKKYAKELCTLKLRYKMPDGQSSKKIVQNVSAREKREKLSNNFNWSAAVASFGMLLRDSEYKGTANYDQVLKLAKSSRGSDKNGYRKEFIDLVSTVQILDE